MVNHPSHFPKNPHYLQHKATSSNITAVVENYRRFQKTSANLISKAAFNKTENRQLHIIKYTQLFPAAKLLKCLVYVV